MIYFAAIVLGAAWRRWWGSERPAWAFPGYRAMQAGVGVLLLCVLGLLTKEPVWRAALDAGLAIGFLSLPIKVSLYPFTKFWLWVDTRWGTPRLLGSWLTGYTTYAELTGGAAVWFLATLV